MSILKLHFLFYIAEMFTSTCIEFLEVSPLYSMPQALQLMRYIRQANEEEKCVLIWKNLLSLVNGPYA